MSNPAADIASGIIIDAREGALDKIDIDLVRERIRKKRLVPHEALELDILRRVIHALGKPK